MPRIPVYTAQGDGAQLRLPSANADALGGQAGRATIGFGQVLTQIDSALQDQRDKLDIAQLDADYQLGMDTAYQEALKEPDVTKQPMAFAKSVDAMHGELMKRPLSNTVRNAFQAHREKLDTSAVIALKHEGRVMETERQIIETTKTADQRMDRAARYSLIGWEAKNGDVTNLNGMATALIDGLEKNRHLSPAKAQAVKEGLQDRYWSEFSRQHPDEMLAMRAGGPTASRPVKLDWGKLATYEQQATYVLHIRQAEQAHLMKQQEAAVKAEQQQNANLLTADVLEGKDVIGRIPTMLRARELDDAVGRTLAEVQQKMASAPDLTRYEKGLATQIEATLSAMKYTPQALQDGLEQGLQSDFLQGKILKDEFTHLMSVWRGVQDHKQTQGHESLDKEVTHAHVNLVRSLQTSGPADKYDALAGQTIQEAEQFFYRKMNQTPNADPWQVMQQAETIFKPVIEKRLGLSKTDKSTLDDAKMKGLKERKAISPAAYKAYTDETQTQRGRDAVQEALKNLPPPPAPGFMDRAKKLFKGSPPDRSGGVMGKE
jgi:hypothetical protein